MKRRIRKKKITIRLYHIDEALNHNAYLIDKYKHDKGINGLISGLALPISNAGLKFNRHILKIKLKRGNY